jgi:uncharacterized protein
MTEEAKKYQKTFNISLDRSRHFGMPGMAYYDAQGEASRDIYKALGYIDELDFTKYYAIYERQDIAGVVIEAMAEECWRDSPVISEKGTNPKKRDSEFEKAWDRISEERKICSYLERTDKISGVGEYGILLLGFDDIKDREDLKKPVKYSPTRKLTYLRPHFQDTAEIIKYDMDPTSYRYGLPELYRISLEFGSDEEGLVVKTRQLDRDSMFKGGTASLSSSFDVHWTRVLHIAEDLTSDDIFGRPRLKRVFNRLYNLELIVGGSAEGYWRSAIPWLNFKLDAEADNTQALADVEEHIQAMLHDLRRFVQLQGIEVQEITPKIQPPTEFFEVCLSLISAATGIPKRILLGSERGELSSAQDETRWKLRLSNRRNNFVQTGILRPLIDRLIEFGVLPKPKEGYNITWVDVFAPSEKERLNLVKLKMECLEIYLRNKEAAIEVLPLDTFLKMLEVEEDDIQKAMDNLEEIKKLLQEETQDIYDGDPKKFPEKKSKTGKENIQ